MLRRATFGVGKNVNELLAARSVPAQSQLMNMSDRYGEKGHMEQAADKTKEMAHNAKETVKEKAHDAKEAVKDAAHSAKETVKDAYNKVTGNDSKEQKTANKVKDAADSMAKSAEKTRQKMGAKMEEGGQKIQGR